MLKSIYEVSLLDLLPETLTRDPQIRACIEGLDEELRKLSKDIRETLILSRIDELSEDVLDLLAWQFHLEFYQPAELDIETKRKLIRESIADHRIRGTPASVEKLLSTIFSNAVVKEWWEYGGEPYTFRIEQLGRILATESDFADFELALNIAKNARSHLETFIIRLNEILEIFLALIESRVELRNQRYSPTVYPEFMANYIGIMDFKAISRHDGDKPKLFIPEIMANLGFFNQRDIRQFSPSRSKDKPAHDLRGTSILDLLTLDLGILLQGNAKPKPLWFFQDAQSEPIYVGLINEQSININPDRHCRQHARLYQTLGIINNRVEKKHQFSNNSWKMSLELGYWINATQIILQAFKILPDSPSKANISFSERLHLYSGIVHQRFDNRISRQRNNLFATFTNFVGLIVSQSIIQYAYSKQIPDESIWYKQSNFLNLYSGIGSFCFEEKNAISPRNLFSKLNFSISFEKKELHQHLTPAIRPHLHLKNESVFVGFLNWFKIYRHAGAKNNSSFYVNSESLKLYYDFARSTLVQHHQNSHDDLKNQYLSIKYGMLDSIAILQHAASKDSFVNDFNQVFQNKLNLKAGFISINSETKREKSIPNLHQSNQNYIGIIDYGATIQKAYSRDKPNLPDKPIESRETLTLFYNLLNIKYEEFKNSSQHKSATSFKIFHDFLNIRAEYQHSNNIFRLKEKLIANFSFISSKTEIHYEKSNYRLDSLDPVQMHLKLYQGFCFKQLVARKDRAHNDSHETLRIRAGLAGITFISQTCRDIVVRDAPTFMHNRQKSKLVLVAYA